MPKQKKVTIIDVAKYAGVSKTTVSRYLGKQYDELAPSTRRKIKKAIEALNYAPNRMASGLKGGRSFIIGMIVADITNPYTVKVLRAAEQHCRAQGYSLMVCNTANDPQVERDYISKLKSHRIDGLIINTTGENNQFLLQLEEETAIVLVDRKVKGLDYDVVGINNYQATAQAIEFLVGKGYKRIAYFTEVIDGISTRNERFNAYKSTLIDKQLYRTEHVYEVTSDQEQLKENFSTFIEQSALEKKAVFAANGVTALKLYRLIQDMKLNIPLDLGFMNFDDLEWENLVQPSLTTLAQPTDEIGRTAVDLLLERINGEASDVPREITFPVHLIERGSTI